MAAAAKKTKAKTVTKAKAKPKQGVARKKVVAKKAPQKSVTAKKKPAQKAALRTKSKKPAAKKIAREAVQPLSSTQKTMEKTMTQSTKQFENFAQEANDLGREGVEALIKSSTIFAKGFEDIFKTTMSIAQGAAEKQAQLAKQAMSSKTPNEWADAQSKIAKANFDDFVTNATKISEMSAKVLTEASEPINQQMTKAVKKATRAAA